MHDDGDDDAAADGDDDGGGDDDDYDYDDYGDDGGGGDEHGDDAHDGIQDLYHVDVCYPALSDAVHSYLLTPTFFLTGLRCAHHVDVQ